MTTHYQTPRILRIGVVLQLLIALFFAAIIIVPIFTVVFAGFKTHAELLLEPFGMPEEIHLENYTNVLLGNNFWRQLRNSLIVMVGTTAGVVSLSAMAAYVFSRLKFRYRELIYNFFTLGLLFPAAVAILPLYLTVRDANLIDTYWGIILPQVAFGLPGTIVILRGFFAQVPKELEEAAAIDGASLTRIFVSIILPIMRPVLASVAVITMVASWNAFFWPLLVATEELYTLPLGVMQFSTQYSTDYAKVLAFISLSMLPAIAFYLAAQRQIISGLTAGAIKG